MNLFQHITTINIPEILKRRRPICILGSFHSGKTVASMGLISKIAKEWNDHTHVVGCRIEEDRGFFEIMLRRTAMQVGVGDYVQEAMASGKLTLELYQDLLTKESTVDARQIHLLENLRIMSPHTAGINSVEAMQCVAQARVDRGDVFIATATVPRHRGLQEAAAVAKAYGYAPVYVTEKVGGDLVLHVA